MTPATIILGTLTVSGRPENVSKARAFVAELARRKELSGGGPDESGPGGGGQDESGPGGRGPGESRPGAPDLRESGLGESDLREPSRGESDLRESGLGESDLRESGLGGSGLSETAALLTSELVTNAVLHSASGRPGGSVTVVVIDAPEGLLVEVIDDGSPEGGPEVRGDRHAAEGHGLFLVERLAADWGYLRDDAGTTVWFRIEAETASASPGADGPRGAASDAGTGARVGFRDQVRPKSEGRVKFDPSLRSEGYLRSDRPRSGRRPGSGESLSSGTRLRLVGRADRAEYGDSAISAGHRSGARSCWPGAARGASG